MTAVAVYPEQFAFNVCIRCKGRKKKCDKVIPSCERCTRLGVRCQYEASESSQLPTPPETSSLDSSQGPVYENKDASIFAEVLTPSAFGAPQAIRGLHPGGQRILTIDEQLTKQAYDITTREVDDIPSSLSRYFKTVHEWFPIAVDEAEVRDNLLRLPHTPDADFAVLVLVIHLISHTYIEEPISERQGPGRFYHSVKGLYSITMSSKPSSLEVVRAGVLLALYEHCQALHDATYQTLGACARMGYTIGLHGSLSPDAQVGAQTSVDVEKRRRVWWGIIILERVSMLEYLDKRLPFAIPSPLRTDLLPSQDGTVHPVADGIPLHAELDVQIPGKIGGYGRLAQSAVLLGYVLSHIVGSGMDSSSCSAARLDNGLRSFAMALLQPDEVDNIHAAYSVCLSALLTLNRFEISAEPVPEEAHERELFQARAKLGFQSVLRMIFENIAACSQLPKRASHSAPVWTLHSISGAVLVRLELGGTGDDEKEWPARLKGLKHMLRDLAPQWKLAEVYLKTIEAAEAPA